MISVSQRELPIKVLVVEKPNNVIVVRQTAREKIVIVTKGPQGIKGDPGETANVEEFIGDPNANYATMYQIFKL